MNNSEVNDKTKSCSLDESIDTGPDRRQDNPKQMHKLGELAALRGQPQGIEAIVCDDITERQALGIAKYKTTVADNPLSLRAWLQHAYEECLDQAIYLRRAISEIEKKGAQ